jgi:hypothetical protein
MSYRFYYFLIIPVVGLLPGMEMANGTLFKRCKWLVIAGGKFACQLMLAGMVAVIVQRLPGRSGASYKSKKPPGSAACTFIFMSILSCLIFLSFRLS